MGWEGRRGERGRRGEERLLCTERRERESVSYIHRYVRVSLCAFLESLGTDGVLVLGSPPPIARGETGGEEE